MKWLTLFTAIVLAACAAYFSIVGLMTIFAGAAISVMVMAGVLEFAKLVSAAWLHYEWERINNLVRIYFTIAVLVLMFITSMGIFGYLSKAHIEQSVKVGGSNELQIDNIERQIRRQQGIISDAETVLTQLDQQVSVLIEYDRIRGPTGSIAVRESQSEERSLLNETVDAAYTRIEELQTNLAPLQQEKLELEVEVGPLKYIAELIYGKENARDNFDVAVRGIIILLVVVFDPLAVMLLVVSTGAFKRDRKQIKPLINEDQIMRMDIEDEETSKDLSEKETSKDFFVDQSASANSETSDIYLQQEQNSEITASESSEANQENNENAGGLKTTLRRRPI